MDSQTLCRGGYSEVDIYREILDTHIQSLMQICKINFAKKFDFTVPRRIFFHDKVCHEIFQIYKCALFHKSFRTTDLELFILGSFDEA